MLPTQPKPTPKRGVGFIRRMTKVGLVGFGGGSVLIPLLERELVKGVGLDERDFIQNTIIANITPGALPVKIAALSGAGLVRTWKVVIATLAMAAPGTFTLIALLALISSLAGPAIKYIEYASVGIAAFILYLLFGFILKVIKPDGNLNLSFTIVTIVAFLATGLNRATEISFRAFGQKWNSQIYELNALQLILCSLGILGLYTLFQAFFPKTVPTIVNSATVKKSYKIPLKLSTLNALIAALMFGVLLLLPGGAAFIGSLAKLALSTATSFGGGEAYVGVADSYFVSTKELDATVFYGQIVPIANALPGPILIKIAAGIMYSKALATVGLFWAIVFAIVTMVIATTVSSAIALLLMSGFGQLGNSRFVFNVSKYMMPVVCGLLISTAISLLSSSSAIASGSGISFSGAMLAIILITCLAPVLHKYFKLPDIVFVALYGVLSTAVLSYISIS